MHSLEFNTIEDVRYKAAKVFTKTGEELYILIWTFDLQYNFIYFDLWDKNHHLLKQNLQFENLSKEDILTIASYATAFLHIDNILYGNVYQFTLCMQDWLNELEKICPYV